MFRCLQIRYCLSVLCVLLTSCGDEPTPPKDDTPPQQTPVVLPDAAYEGQFEGLVRQTESNRAQLTLFSRQETYEGSLVVASASGDTIGFYRVSVEPNPQNSNEFQLNAKPPQCMDAQACEQFPRLDTLTGRYERGQLTFASKDIKRQLKLTIDPDFYREPDDGIRPSGCDDDPEMCEKLWPPTLAMQPGRFSVVGEWDGNIFLAPEYYSPHLTACTMIISSDKASDAPSVMHLTCEAQVDGKMVFDALNVESLTFDGQPEAILMTEHNGQRWRWTGKLNSQLVDFGVRRLYRFYGHVDVAHKNTDDWRFAGTFSMTSWGVLR